MVEQKVNVVQGENSKDERPLDLVSKPAVTTQAGGVIGVTGKEDFKIGKGAAKRPERVKTLKA